MSEDAFREVLEPIGTDAQVEGQGIARRLTDTLATWIDHEVGPALAKIVDIAGDDALPAAVHAVAEMMQHAAASLEHARGARRTIDARTYHSQSRADMASAITVVEIAFVEADVAIPLR